MPDLTYETFVPQLGSTFQFMVEGQAALSLELVEVENLSVDQSDRQNQHGRKPFSLIFHGPLSPVMPQQTLQLEHAQLGRMQIFVVPVGPDRKLGQSMCYQAIFN